MFLARRLPVYVLHDGSAEAVSGLSRLVDGLRCDPKALEMVWLSFISLAREAKQALPLTEITVIGNVGPVELESGAPDLDGGLYIFESDAQKNLRARTSTHPGDWRPTLVLYLAANPQAEVSGGLDTIKARRCGYKLAFLGPAVSPLARARLKDGGFELIGVADGVVEPISAGSPGRPWAEVLCRALSGADDWRVGPGPDYGMPPPPIVSLDGESKPAVKAGEDAASTPTANSDSVRPVVIERKTSNLLTADLWKISTDGRITRRGLLLYLLLCFGIIVLSVFIGYLSMTLASIVGTVALGVFVLGLIKRAHDLGLSGWYILIPFFGFWLFLAPGEVGTNKFGPDTRASGDVGESGAR